MSTKRTFAGKSESSTAGAGSVAAESPELGEEDATAGVESVGDDTEVEHIVVGVGSDSAVVEVGADSAEADGGHTLDGTSKIPSASAKTISVLAVLRAWVQVQVAE